MDPGWFEKATLVATSVPNPFAGSQAGMATGLESSSYVNFTVTSDKLQMLDQIPGVNRRIGEFGDSARKSASLRRRCPLASAKA